MSPTATRPLLGAAALLTATLTVYLATPLHSSSGDSFANVLTAVSLLQGRQGRVDTLTLPAGSAPPRHSVYLIEGRAGGWVSPYGIGVPLALLPVYAAARLAGMPDEVLLSDGLNRAIAAAWSALAVTLFWWSARRWGDPVAAWFATAALAFGTSALSLLSREVWQHSLLFLLSAAVLALLWRRDPGPSAAAAAAAGVLAGWGVAARPTALLLAAAWGWLVWRSDRRRLLPFLAGLLPALLGLAAYQSAVLGDPLLPGQLRVGEIRFGGGAAPASAHTLLLGLAGVLLSPGRGLFVYSPVLLLALLAPLLLRRAAAARRPELVLIVAPMLAAIAANVVAAAAWREWWGGFTYGPRYLSDTLVPWGVLLFAALSQRGTLAAAPRRVLAAAAVLLLAVSIACHAAGLLVDPYGARSHNVVLQPDAHPDVMWRWSEFPPLYNLRVWLGRPVGSTRPRRRRRAARRETAHARPG
jgi:hypothetical protein